MTIRFEPPKKNKKRTRKSRCIVNILVIGVAVISVLGVYKALSKYIMQQQGYKESKAIYTDIEKFVFENPKQNMEKTSSDLEPNTVPKIPDIKENLNFNKLKAVNPAAYGWLKVRGTNISYPVTYADDNEYWLTHAFDNQVSSNGCIFVDFRCKEKHQNTVIYGHRMQDGSMFYELDYLESEQYYKDNDCHVEILREDGTYIYEIYAVALVDADGDVYRTDFSNNFTLDDYLSYVKSKALYTTREIDKVNNESVLLTLSTCQSISKVPVRRVVCCVLTEIKPIP